MKQSRPGQRPATLAHAVLRLAPGLLVWVAACLVLAWFGTPWRAILLFSAYLVVVVMLPGVLLWRLLRRNQDGLAADLAFGTGFGLALSILTYLPGRAVGLQLLPVAVPVLTVVAFLAVRRLRPYWRSGGPPLPWWWSWSVAAAGGLGLWVITRYGLQIEPIAFPDADFQYSDMPYQLALAAELKNHLPGRIPFVIGQSLDYHWFLHAQVAATSWQTGIEMDLLLRRLVPVLAALLPVLSVAALATGLARKAWAGPLAAWLLITVTTFDVYGWGGRELIGQAAYSSGVLMYSLTHAFAVVLAFPVVRVVVALLRGERGPGSWFLLVPGLAALAGAKASFVPMLAAAVVLVAAVELLTRRRIARTTLVLVAVVLAVFALAQVVLFSAGSSGAAIGPGQSGRALAARLGYDRPESDFAVLAAVATANVTLLVSWAVAGAGMIGLLLARRWRDPVVVFLAGFVLSGLGAGLILRHPGFSQLYFVRAAFPIAVAASAWGLVLLLGDRPLRRTLPRVLAALAAGMLLAKGLSAVTGRGPRSGDGAVSISLQVIWPWLTVFVVAAVVVLVLRRTPERAAALGLGVLIVLGTAVVHLPQTALTTAGDQVCVGGPDRPECRQTRRQIPDGGALAARYLRDRAGRDDLLATNSHCMPVYAARRCDARNFWLAAYAERRVLVEGWAYTPTAQSRRDSDQAISGPFWDQALLATNDRAFTAPTKPALDQLWTRYGVRWLVFDTVLDRSPPALDRLAHRRFTAGTVEVWELSRP